MAQRETVTTSTLRRVFRSVKRACYSGLGSTALRQEVARRATEVVPFDACALAAVDPDVGLLTDVVAQGLPEAMSTEFLYHVYPEGEAERFQDLARSGKILATLNARRGPDSDTDPYYSAGYRELLRRHRLERELRGALCCEGELWGTWCIMRERSSPRFCSREQRFVRRLAPHLARGLRTAALLDLARSEGAGAETEDPELRPGVVVLNGSGRIDLVTPAAAAVLGDLGVEGGTETPVPLVIRQLSARLRSRLQASPPGEASDLRDEVVLRARGRSGRWYSLCGSLAEPDPSGSSATVVLVQVARRREMTGLLTRLYGLSAREREVLSLVARGETTKGIAQRLGISPYTVQDHLGHACEKVGVRGRRALLAKLFIDRCSPALDA